MTAVFEEHRPALLGIAYRMLGDVGAAEDVVQEAWFRWSRASEGVERPRAWLGTVVTRLCLDRIRADSRDPVQVAANRLPEPVGSSQGLVELDDGVTLAFLLLLQRLSATERAVWVLHEAFDFTHVEIGAQLGKSPEACRQLLRRARSAIEAGKSRYGADREGHTRLLEAFARASRAGDVDGLLAVLAEDAELVVDSGAGGATYGRLRNLDRPLVGAQAIARFSAAAGAQGPALEQTFVVANGRPGILLSDGDGPHSLLQIAAGEDGRITAVFIVADRARLGRLR